MKLTATKLGLADLQVEFSVMEEDQRNVSKSAVFRRPCLRHAGVFLPLYRLAACGVYS